MSHGRLATRPGARGKPAIRRTSARRSTLRMYPILSRTYRVGGHVTETLESSFGEVASAQRQDVCRVAQDGAMSV